MLDPKAVVQRELRADAPVVLRVAAVVVRVDVERRRQRHRARRRLEIAARIAEHEAGDGVAVGRATIIQSCRRRQLAAEIEARARARRIQQVDANLPIVGAELERVRPDELRVGAVGAP